MDFDFIEFEKHLKVKSFIDFNQIYFYVFFSNFFYSIAKKILLLVNTSQTNTYAMKTSF